MRINITMDALEYTNAEMLDMIMIYGETRGNGRASQRIYNERFPNRNVPHHGVFLRIAQRLRESGSFTRRNEGGRPMDAANVEDRVLDYVYDNPTTSTRAAAAALGLPNHMTVFNILNRNDLHPYRYQRVQALNPGDFLHREQFCRWLLDQVRENGNFASNILFTDEATFSREGVFNHQNLHEWSADNPHNIRQHDHQHRISINVWAGIIGNHLIGPYLLPERLTGHVYSVFLEQVLPGLLENIPNQDRIWFQHDGAPAHFSRRPRDILNARYPNAWIGRGGPTHWPPRSPDLTPLDFHLWGYMKNLVYETVVDSEQDLIGRIVAAAGKIKDEPQILQRVQRSFLNRCRLCLEQNGRNFEHLL